MYMNELVSSKTVEARTPRRMLWKIVTGRAETQARPKSARCRRSSGRQARGVASFAAGNCLQLGFGSAVDAQRDSQALSPVKKEAVMTTHAKGTFDVKLDPQKADSKEAESANLGRMSIDKKFHGDLEATSKGEMLSAATEVKGSAGYVAMERVSGTLHGRSGNFVLQHSATMTRGVPQMSVTVVPDSGTGELVGLAGKMTIKIANGQHFYEFEYTVPETPCD
jgi:Protein of unknown function (DUF3224)